MNRSLHSLLNIKFNPKRNNWLGKESKKKYNTRKPLKNFNYVLVRGFCSNNSKTSSSPPNPPPNIWETIIVSCVMGCYINYNNNRPRPGSGEPLLYIN